MMAICCETPLCRHSAKSANKFRLERGGRRGRVGARSGVWGGLAVHTAGRLRRETRPAAICRLFFQVHTRNFSVSMNPQSTVEIHPTSTQPRFWPVWLVLGVQGLMLILTVTPQINNFTRFVVMMAGPLVCLLLFVIWLLAASRLRIWERFGLLGVTASAGILSGTLADPSMGTPIWIYGVPLAMFLIVLGLWRLREGSPRRRLAWVSLLVAVGWSFFLVGRLDGFDGSYWPEFRWRWRATPEERLLADGRGQTPATPAKQDSTGGRGNQESRSDESAAAESAAVVSPVDDTGGARATTASELVAEPQDWVGFRGPRRDSRVTGTTFATDWSSRPPRERWRIAIGPAWSAFAQVGSRLFTQEQRGESELVVCYDADTGQTIWTHAETTRFSDIVAGPGPRATPTFADGRLYTLGARAGLTCLDARDGKRIWQRDLMKEVGAKLPVWGFSGSPLVIQGCVIVYAGGNAPHGLVAYDAQTGEPVWQIAAEGMNFSSAQAVTLAGEEQVLFTMESGLLGLEPRTGRLLWQIKPEGWNAPPMVQPQAIDQQSVLVALGDGIGLARVEVRREGAEWRAELAWSSRALKPAFNDFVYHQGFVYGFDQNILVCLDAATGQRRWKQGRYGFGQLLLLEASDALLITSESGEVVLVAADSTGHRELGRFTAIRGKTWNHPIVFRDRLVVRNGEEAACYELPVGNPLSGAEL